MKKYLVYLPLMMLPALLSPLVLEVALSVYLQVTTFVGLSLMAVLLLERAVGVNLAGLASTHPRGSCLVGAGLGALPGCGGAIAIVTYFTAGKVSFGVLVATLTATMGDAAFLLLAREPATAFIVIAVGLVAGTVMGLVTDLIKPGAYKMSSEVIVTDEAAKKGLIEQAWWYWLVPGLGFGIVSMTGIAVPVVVEWLMMAVGIVGLALTALLFTQTQTNEASTTLLVTSYAMVAFIVVEVSTTVFAISLTELTTASWLWLPLLAAMIGFIPGCGPQILLMTFYVQGLLPLGALMANALSNDGDALIPALALAPAAALAATVLTTIPALLIGYLFLWL